MLKISKILIFILGLAYFFYSFDKIMSKDDPSYIVNAINQCKIDSQRNDCLKNAIEYIRGKFKLQEIINTFQENINTLEFFSNCHTALHFLGQEEYKKGQNVTQSLISGTPLCFAGYYHGVLEEHFRQNNLDVTNMLDLKNEAKSICGNKNSFAAEREYFECLHGLGHALIFALDGELPISLKVCDELNDEVDRNWCYSGIFMENSTSSTNSDHPSKYLRENEPLYPCTILENKYLKTCYTLQSFYLAEINEFDWPKISQACMKINLEFRNNCFNAIGQVLVGFTQDVGLISKTCESLKTGQEDCVQGAAGALSGRYNKDIVKLENFCNSLIKHKNICLQKTEMVKKEWGIKN